MRQTLIIGTICLALAAVAGQPADPLDKLGAGKSLSTAKVELKDNKDASTLTVLLDGKEAIVYRYGDDLEIPFFHPVRSPSGKLMTLKIADAKKKQNYPHHRSFWFTDKIQLAGQRDVNFYMAHYSRMDKKDPTSPFRDRIKHVEFLPTKIEKGKGTARTGMKLVWQADRKTPYLDETRNLRIVALGEGQYFLDITFTVTAAYGDVRFTSDASHYAWPYVRMHPQFSVEQGGKITSSTGGVNQKGTNGKDAQWVDYSSAVDGVTEGLAIFSHPDNDQPHKRLTRDYGCFGPRRIDKRSGNRKYVLKKGQSLKRRVGILVHSGDVKTGAVSRLYKMYAEGNL